MASVTEIRKGSVLKHRDDLFVVTDAQHITPGKGTPFTRARMKSLSSGKVIEETFKDNESVNIVEVNYRDMQYLYQDGSFFVFMDQENYEQAQLEADMVGDDAQYLKEGLEVIVVMYENQPVALNLPRKISYTVADAPPAVKGDSAGGNVTKEVVCDNGLKVAAPIFIKSGDRILVNTESGAYVERDNS